MDQPETYLSWCDDGITLMCEREECMVPGPCPSGECFFQEVLPFRLTPAVAQKHLDAHVLRHTREHDGRYTLTAEQRDALNQLPPGTYTVCSNCRQLCPRDGEVLLTVNGPIGRCCR